MIRRLTVIGVYGAYIALAMYVLIFGGKEAMLNAIPSALFAIAAWAGIWILASFTSSWRMANAPASELDERESQARSGAYFSAYGVFMAAVFLGLVAIAFGGEFLGIAAWDAVDVSALLWGVFLFGLTLPAAILMWTHDAQSQDGDREQG